MPGGIEPATGKIGPEHEVFARMEQVKKSKAAWEAGIAEKYRVGDVAKCKVIKVTDFGVFVELEDGVEGLIHVSETGIEPSSRIGDAMQANDVIRAQIIKMDIPERKIALSIKAYKNEQERAQKKDK